MTHFLQKVQTARQKDLTRELDKFNKDFSGFEEDEDIRAAQRAEQDRKIDDIVNAKYPLTGDETEEEIKERRHFKMRTLVKILQDDRAQEQRAAIDRIIKLPDLVFNDWAEGRFGQYLNGAKLHLDDEDDDEQYSSDDHSMPAVLQKLARDKEFLGGPYETKEAEESMGRFLKRRKIDVRVKRALVDFDDELGGFDANMGRASKRQRMDNDESDSDEDSPVRFSKRQRMEDSTSSGYDGFRSVSPAEAVRIRRAKPAGHTASASRVNAVAGPSASGVVSRRMAIHRRPKPPHEGEIDSFPKVIYRGLDKNIKQTDHTVTEDHVYVAMHTFTGGPGNPHERSFDTLGHFDTFEDANVKAMEHVWELYDEYLERHIINARPLEFKDSEDICPLVWWVGPEDGCLDMSGPDRIMGSFRVWVEKRERKAEDAAWRSRYLQRIPRVSAL